jgi:hypothetical protein
VSKVGNLGVYTFKIQLAELGSYLYITESQKYGLKSADIANCVQEGTRHIYTFTVDANNKISDISKRLFKAGI